MTLGGGGRGTGRVWTERTEGEACSVDDRRGRRKLRLAVRGRFLVVCEYHLVGESVVATPLAWLCLFITLRCFN